MQHAAEDKIALDYSQNTQNETAPLPNMQNDSSAKYAAGNCRLLQNKRNDVNHWTDLRFLYMLKRQSETLSHAEETE